MHNFVIYLLVSSACLTLTYGFFRFFVENRISPVLIRIFLLAVIVFSMLLPFHSYGIDIGVSNPPDQVHEIEEAMRFDSEIAEGRITQPASLSELDEVAVKSRLISWMLIKYIYFMVIGFFIIRLLLNFLKILYLRIRHRPEKYEENQLVFTNQISNSFSFFGWIFINREGKSDAEIQNIIIHEKIHASQYHSLDLLLIELVIALMWFNPIVWLLRNMLQQTHEYLADEGALNAGVNKPVYKAHLLNQVAEERLIALSSGFNPAYRPGRHSLIKKRIIMMTKPKFGQKMNLRFLTIIPLAILLFTGVACINGKKSDEEKKRVAAVAPTKMNVLYIGVDNPMSIAVSGYDSDQLRIAVDQGKVIGENGKYIIKPAQPGTLKVFVYADEELVSETHFRVKTVPDPVAKLAGKKGGEISKEELLKAGKVYVEMENFDFDLSWEIVSFVMSATVPGSYTVREEISQSGTFSESQIELINSLIENQKLMIEEIEARGPDGATRKLGSLVFTIS